MSSTRPGRRPRWTRGTSLVSVTAALTLLCGVLCSTTATTASAYGRPHWQAPPLKLWSNATPSAFDRYRMQGSRLGDPRQAASPRHFQAAAGPVVDPVDLRVLVLATKGDPNPDGVHVVPAGSWDWDLSTMTAAMDYAGVPYDTYKSTSKQLCVAGSWKMNWTLSPAPTDTTCTSGNVVSWAGGITAAQLWDGTTHAYYEGVMQTNGTLSYLDPSGNFVSSALASTEWSALWAFESQFGIRTVSANTYPTSDFGLSYKGEDGNPTTATWTAAAAGVFPYINTSGQLPIGSAWTYRASADPTDPTTSVILTDSAQDALAVVHTYPAQGNRQALALTFDSAAYLEHGEVLGYGMVSWVTKGLFLGSRHAVLDPQPDDLFIADSIWQGPADAHPTVCGTRPDDPSLPEYRITGADFTALVNWQNTKQADPVSKALTLEFPYNTEGTTSGYWSSLGLTSDTLTPVVKANQAKFKFVNHTYDHQNLDGRYVTATVSKTGSTTMLVGTGGQFNNSWGHTVIATGVPASDVVSNVSLDANTVTLSKATTLTNGSTVTVWMGVTYSQAQTEISQNASIGAQLGLKTQTGANLVQPDISGLTNQDFLQGAYDKGVRYLISDTSLTGDPHTYGANEGLVNTGTFNKTLPGASATGGAAWNIYTIARTPVNLYFNVNSPSRWLAEDNCLYPAGAYGHVDTYAALLDRESNNLLTYLLDGQNRPLMFHQPNVTAYDGVHSLLGDLIDATLTKYEALVNVPLTSPTMNQLGAAQSNKENYDQALQSGHIVASTVPGVSVTVTNTGVTPVQVPVTGVNGGAAYSTENYAGQYISTVTLAAGQTVTLPL